MSDETILPTENQGPGENPNEEKGSFRLDLYFWVQALVMALVCLILVFTLVGRIIGVVGSSMLPTLHEGDLLLLQSVGYTPKQGDVVVLRKPDFPWPETAPVVKRVIAVEGQHVRVDYDAHCVYVDGVALDEPYINGIMEQPTDSALIYLDLTVPEGSVYVLGDNRNHSSDSRHQLLGPVDERYVLGRALWVISPFQNFGAID
ncbi:MAG: signal peptidase I [Oscillospiraceae bacterium]|nr:signal peptidase I [Oscillospiraceae bacterium]